MQSSPSHDHTCEILWNARWNSFRWNVKGSVLRVAASCDLAAFKTEPILIDIKWKFAVQCTFHIHKHTCMKMHDRNFFNLHRVSYLPSLTLVSLSFSSAHPFSTASIGRSNDGSTASLYCQSPLPESNFDDWTCSFRPWGPDMELHLAEIAEPPPKYAKPSYMYCMYVCVWLPFSEVAGREKDLMIIHRILGCLLFTRLFFSCQWEQQSGKACRCLKDWPPQPEHSTIWVHEFMNSCLRSMLKKTRNPPTPPSLWGGARLESCCQRLWKLETLGSFSGVCSATALLRCATGFGPSLAARVPATSTVFMASKGDGKHRTKELFFMGAKCERDSRTGHVNWMLTKNVRSLITSTSVGEQHISIGVGGTGGSP